MSKVIIISGHVGAGQTTAIEALIKAVEAKTGETVECVMVHKEEAEFWTKPLLPKPESKEMILLAPDPDPNPIGWETSQKIKGHIRPYKFHK